MRWIASLGMTVLMSGLIAAVVAFSAARPLEARKEYLDAFKSKYEDLTTKADKAKCGLCHGNQGKDKKTRNDYGKALQEALGEKSVTDEDKIKEALGKIEEKGDVGGKTFGDLIKDGKLPNEKAGKASGKGSGKSSGKSGKPGASKNSTGPID